MLLSVEFQFHFNGFGKNESVISSLKTFVSPGFQGLMDFHIYFRKDFFGDFLSFTNGYLWFLVIYSFEYIFKYVSERHCSFNIRNMNTQGYGENSLEITSVI